MKAKHLTLWIAAILLSLAAYTQLTIFVVPPIGIVPDGQTLIILRPVNGKFVDSPDAMCERIQGGVNLLCRALVLGAIAQKAEVLFRLPYSEMLYSISTDGKRYEN
jgi:hypothetical protein